MRSTFPCVCPWERDESGGGAATGSNAQLLDDVDTRLVQTDGSAYGDRIDWIIRVYRISKEMLTS